MKKITALLLIVLMLCLSACSNNDNANSSETDTEVTSNISSENTTTNSDGSSSSIPVDTSDKAETSTPAQSVISSNQSSNKHSSSEGSSKDEITPPSSSNNPSGEYTVTFDYGFNNKKITAKSKSFKVSKPTDPTRVGYKFLGWYAPNETEQWNFSGHAVTTDMTLTAKWGMYGYYITYLNVVDGEPSSIVKKSEVEYNQTASMGQGIENPEKGIVVDFKTYSVATSDSLYNQKAFNTSISFDADCYDVHTCKVPFEFCIESATFTVPELKISGCAFLGWTYEGQTTPVKTVVIPKGTAKDFTLTANWKTK